MTWSGTGRRVRLYAGKEGYVDAEWLGSGGLHVRDADVGDSHSLGSGFDVPEGCALFVHLFRERFEGVETLRRAQAFAKRHGIALSSQPERPPETEERTFVGVEQTDLVYLACLESEVRLYRIPMMETEPTATRVITDPVSFLFALLLERHEGEQAYGTLRRAVADAGLTVRDGFRDY